MTTESEHGWKYRKCRNSKDIPLATGISVSVGTEEIIKDPLLPHSWAQRIWPFTALHADHNQLKKKRKTLIVGSQISTGLFHVNVIRQTSGYITEIQGVAVKALDFISQRYHFTYSSLQVNDSYFEKQSDTLPGLAYYLEKGKSDLVIGPIVMTTNHLAVMDFAEGYAYSTVALIIPMPESSDNNAAAIVHPFQIPAAKDGVYKQLGDKMRSNSKSRCAKRQECVDLVKSGPYVYLQGVFTAINIIDEDFKVANTCRLAFARKIESMPGPLAWTLTKKSPYTKFITKG
uniref:Ionotropic glutamate receptor L-glutamate and glycine-binding domain-containing protein n=1 Tax=Daphnia galeata TaxID=27404 RepID=A0A8J2WAE0_9CRUS|nr:unnamed protein product [Daphnia galeata]